MESRVEINRWLVLANSASSLLTHALNVTVVVWVHQHLLRRISPEEYAVYPLIVGFIALAPLFSAIFLSGAGRYVVEAYARGDDKRLTAVVSTLVPLTMLAASLLFGAGTLLAWQINHVLKLAPEQVSDARLMLLLLIGAAAIRVTLTPFGLGLYVRQKFIAINVLRLGGQALRLLLLVVLLLGVSTRVIWLVVAAVAMEVFVATAQVFLSSRALPSLRFHFKAFSWPLARELTSFGSWSTMLNVLGLVRTTLQPIILNRFATAFDVTCFGVGSMIQSELMRLNTLTTAPLHPPITAMFATGDRSGLRHAFLRGSRYAVWAITLCVIPLIVFRREVIALYIGDQYQLAAFVLAGTLASMPLRYAGAMMAPLAAASASLRPVALRGLVMQVSTVLLTLYLVIGRQLGAAGPALAMLIVGVVGVPLLHWPLGWRLADVTPRQWLRETVLPGFLPALVGVPIWVGLEIAVRPATWLSLGVCTMIGLAGYLTVLVGFCLRPHERDDLRQIIRAVSRPRFAQIRQMLDGVFRFERD